MTLFTNPGAGTSELFNSELLQDQVANMYNWGRLQSNSRFFSLFSNIGVGQSFENTEFEIVGTADYNTKITLAASQSLAVAAINAESAFIDMDTAFGVSGLNGSYKVGDAFVGFGYCSAATGSRSAGDRLNLTLLVSDVNSLGLPKFKTMYITKNGSGAYTAATMTQANGGLTLILTKIDELDGDAPDIELLRPTIDYNCMQMFRVPYGQGKVAGSAKTKYDNSLAYQSLIEQDKLFRMIDAALLFGQKNRPANTMTSFRESSSGIADGGTGEDRSLMKGLAGFLGIEDLSASSVVSQIDSGSDVDFWSLKSWASNFVVGNEMKYAFAGSAFADKLEQAAARVHQYPIDGEISFPRITFQFKEYNLGNITIRVIRNRNMEVMGQKVYDGTSHASPTHYMMVIDPEYFKINYHANAYFGIMAPSLYDIDVTNNSHKDKKEWKACLSCSLWKPQAHGVYGIAG